MAIHTMLLVELQILVAVYAKIFLIKMFCLMSTAYIL